VTFAHYGARYVIVAALVSGIALPALADCKGLSIEQAWIPQAPPVAAVLAGYARLSNQGDRPIRIDAVDGADFGSVEMHQMSMQGGIMQMRPLSGLDVPAHGSLVLADGDKHLMLMDPRRPLKAGDASVLTLHCGVQSQQASFAVRLPQP
jgi:copper(I)-binding protein